MTGGDLLEQDQLAAMISELARTSLSGSSLQSILDQLVEEIAAALPVSAAGITLISPGIGPLYVAASDEVALRFERMQTEFEEGPCPLCYELGIAVSIPDLHAERRFPAFVEAAEAAGFAAVFTFLLCHRDEQLGILDLYRDIPGELGVDDLLAALRIADEVAASISHAQVSNAQVSNAQVSNVQVANAEAPEAAVPVADRGTPHSLHDDLTGLANRRLLRARLEHAAARAERSRSHAAVLFADLDRFRLVNDTYGHQLGDELLVAVGSRLAALVRPGDTLARVSSDEFVFLCEEIQRVEDAESLASRIKAAIERPFELTEETIKVSASIGIAFAGPGEPITDQLIIDANIAMYQAKRKGGSRYQVIDLGTARAAKANGRLEQELHTAFSTGQLDIAYQPIVQPADGFITGVEALLQWDHPQRGLMRGADVSALVEGNSLVSSIGPWLLEHSFSMHETWRQMAVAVPIGLAVNVPMRELAGPSLTENVAAIIERTNIDPRLVTLEVTESVFIEDVARTLAVLADLKSLGVSLALDDFGTGASSLSYLNELPIDIIKIDRRFVAKCAYDRAAASIVAALTSLAHDLGMTVIAEGVETLGQRAAVHQLGCDLAQGDLFGHPMDGETLGGLLARGDGKGPKVATEARISAPHQLLRPAGTATSNATLITPPPPSQAAEESGSSKALRALGDRVVLDAWAFQFGLLATPARIALMVCLAEAGPISVSELALAMGHQPDNVSHSLRYLRKHGIVMTDRHGTTVRYSLADFVTRQFIEDLRSRPAPPSRVQRRTSAPQPRDSAEE